MYTRVWIGLRKNMVLQQDNITKIYSRIEALKEYLEYLESIKDTSLEDLQSNIERRGAIERYLQLSIESCIDIAELIISDQRFATPESGRDAIIILGNEAVLDKNFAENFSQAAGFRNILIHDYVKIDYDLLHKYLQENLSDFHKFIEQILKFLK